jgi:hypothetical protein
VVLHTGPSTGSVRGRRLNVMCLTPRGRPTVRERLGLLPIVARPAALDAISVGEHASSWGDRGDSNPRPSGPQRGSGHPSRHGLSDVCFVCLGLVLRRTAAGHRSPSSSDVGVVAPLVPGSRCAGWRPERCLPSPCQARRRHPRRLIVRGFRLAHECDGPRGVSGRYQPEGWRGREVCAFAVGGSVPCRGRRWPSRTDRPWTSRCPGRSTYPEAVVRVVSTSIDRPVHSSPPWCGRGRSF